PNPAIVSGFSHGFAPLRPGLLGSFSNRIIPVEEELPMRRLSVVCLTASCLLATAGTAAAEPSYAIAMHGEPALPADFDHFPYVNPGAPKGGHIDYSVPGTFDSLN